MLAKSASEEWLKDESEEIFIERDGSTFRHVLSYMRDGKVILPVTEPKKSFVDELTYYGVEVRGEDIDDGKAQLQSYPFQFATSILPPLEKFIGDLRKCMKETEELALGQEVAFSCVQKYFEEKKPGKEVNVVLDKSDEIIYSNKQSIFQIANDYLSNVGLKVVIESYDVYGGIKLIAIDPVASKEETE